MPVKSKKWYPFSHPLALLSFYDENILSGKIKLYDWQKEVSEEFSRIPEPGFENEIDLVTNNGSGKTSLCLAPAAIYIASQFDTSEVVLTSASGVQADKQTGRFVKRIAERMNAHHKEDLWTIQDRKLVFHPTDGYIDIFATDEAMKAEGWHPRDFDSAFAKLVDEAKAVQDDIFEALDRCSGSQWYFRASSPRIGTLGYFYKKVVSGLTKLFRITAYQCPHLSANYINNIINTYGLHSPVTRSIIFAEFTSVDESIVISRDALIKLIATNPLKCIQNQVKRCGTDIAAGGDENVSTYFEGNVQRALRPFREKDTTKTKRLLIELWGSWGISKDSEYNFCDDGHVGHAVIDMLQAEGWNVKRVINQSRALRLPDVYANRGAELYFSFNNFVNNLELVLINDPILIDQLSSRYYKQSGIGSKIILESKLEARAKGHGSPDRADATVLALSDIQSPFFINIGEKVEVPRSRTGVTQAELVEYMDQLKYSNAFKEFSNNKQQGGVLGNIHAMLGGSDNQSKSRLEELLELSKL